MKIDINFPPLLQDVMKQITIQTNKCIAKYDQNKEMKVDYSGILLNKYETGQHSIAWHADDETGLKKHAPIASLSLGAIRIFKMRCLNIGIHAEMERMPATMHISLLPGSLLIMGGQFQSYWQHSVEKQLDIVDPRINATLRHYAHKI